MSNVLSESKDCSPDDDDGIVVEWHITSTCFVVPITAFTSAKLQISRCASSSTTKGGAAATLPSEATRTHRLRRAVQFETRRP